MQKLQFISNEIVIYHMPINNLCFKHASERKKWTSFHTMGFTSVKASPWYIYALYYDFKYS